MQAAVTFPPIHEGFERLPVKGAESGEWDVPAGIVPAHDAARAVAALRIHSKLGLKRRTAVVNINTLLKLNEEWPADLPAPSGPLEDLLVYAMEIAQPAAQEAVQQAAPVARAQSSGHFGVAAASPSSIAAGAQSPEQLGPLKSPITAPATRCVTFDSPNTESSRPDFCRLQYKPRLPMDCIRQDCVNQCGEPVALGVSNFL